jgi:hypothetical protein
MVQDARPPEGTPPEGERRKTTIIREGPPRPELLAAMEEQRRAPPRESVEKTVATGTLVEGLAGTCSAALAIIALLGTSPLTLTAIGVIILGGAILFSAGGFAAMLGRLRSRLRWGELVAGGVGLDALIGAAVIAGGILVLANVVPMTLLPVSIIVLGGCYLLASGGLQFFLAGPGTAFSVSAGTAAGGATAAEILVGLGAAALGVLALAGLQTLLLSEIAVLALGLGVLAKCMAFSTHMAGRVAGS